MVLANMGRLVRKGIPEVFKLFNHVQDGVIDGQGQPGEGELDVFILRKVDSNIPEC